MITKYFTGVKTVDKIIFGLILLFAVSLTNSIFINQIGYFFPLIILTYLLVIKKDNRFEKNGLEIAFILFLSAELISAIFSVDQGYAFKLFFKRLILLPIVYTIVAVANDSDKAKLIFKFYIGAALITMLLYIVFAYEHFIAQLYSIELKGPSPFQYVMTAGGLMSFTMIFFFAFLLNEKTKITIRLFYLLAFGIAAIGLFASYTRAAWLGGVAGILMIVILKRKWLILAPLILVLLVALFFFKSESKVYEYVIKDNQFVQTNAIKTEGRATRVICEGDTLLIADYERGVVAYKDGKVVQKIETPSPVTQVKKWRDNYYLAYLADTRILLLNRGKNGEFHSDKIFTSPGKTTFFKVLQGKFYIADKDSGLTIFQNPLNLAEKITFKKLNGIESFDGNSTRFISFTPDDHKLKLYTCMDGLPVTAVDSFDTKSIYGLVWLNNDHLFFQGGKEFVQFIISNNKLRKVVSQELIGAIQLVFNNKNIFACTLDGKILEADIDSSHIGKFKQITPLGYSPFDFIKSGDKFYTAFNKRNRLASIYDPYHETNIERMNIWRTGFKILADHPLFGVGDIDLGNLYSQYKDKYLKENFGHMHNNFVHLLVILGVVGFAVVMFMLFKIFQLHLKIYKTLKDIPFVSSYALGATAAFVGFLFSGLGEWNFGDQEIITMVWITLGLNIAFYKSYLQDTKTN